MIDRRYNLLKMLEPTNKGAGTQTLVHTIHCSKIIDMNQQIIHSLFHHIQHGPLVLTTPIVPSTVCHNSHLGGQQTVRLTVGLSKREI